MPTGPNGEKRPGNTVANALKVARIATREESEQYVSETRNGGVERAKALTAERRSEIARKAATARWAVR